MLNLTIVAVGRLKEAWQREGVGEYLKRLEGFCRPSVAEIDEYRLPDNPSAAQIQKGLEAPLWPVPSWCLPTPFPTLELP